MCIVSICCVFVEGTISGAMVQVAVSKQRNWLCFVAREYRESISWCCCSRNMGERCTGSASPVSEDFSSPSAAVLLVSCLHLPVRAPGRLSCFAVYKQLCVQKFTRIYNVMALCESSALGTELADLSV